MSSREKSADGIEKATSLQCVVFGIIEKELGVCNKLVVPKVFITMLRDKNAALFLGELIYWQGRGRGNDGYFYKSSKEWQESTGLSPHTIRALTCKFVGMGIINTFLKKERGAPVIHYKIEEDALSNWIRQNCTKDKAEMPNRKSKIAQTLTYPNSYLPSNPVKTTPGIPCGIVSQLEQKKPIGPQAGGGAGFHLGAGSLSFSDFFNSLPLQEKKDGGDTLSLKGEAINIFMQKYRNAFAKEHPKQKPSTWRKVLEKIDYYDDPEFLSEMMDNYFLTKFKQGCNYAIPHFLSEEVFMMRAMEVNGGYVAKAGRRP
jgi:hypothetical protein